MKSKLPFRLSAAGLFSLAVSQTLYSPIAWSQDLTVTAAGAVTPSAAVDSAVQAILSTSATLATATVTANVQSSINGATDAGLVVGPSNALSASATGNSAALSQQIAGGEDAVAVGLSSRNLAASNVSATLSASSVGVSIDGTSSGTGALAVTQNTATATARANDGSSSLVATGANAGQAGNDAAATTTLGTDVVVTGDLVSASYQLNSASNSTASLTAGAGDAVIGASLATAAADLSTSGGLTVSGNSATATAGGNRLSQTLSDQLVGDDVDVAVGTVQQQTDGDVSAATEGLRLGVAGQASGAAFHDSALTVTDNGLGASATGNSLSNLVSSDLSGSGDRAAVRSLQDLTASTTGNDISATVTDGRVGVEVSGSDLAGVSAAISANTVSAAATAQSLSERFIATPGAINGPISQSATQQINPTGNDVAAAARVGDNSLELVVGLDANGGTASLSGGQLTVDGNRVEAVAGGNNGQLQIDDFSGNVAGSINSNLTQTAIQTAAANTIDITSDLEEVYVGVASAATIDDIELAVTGNRLVGASSVNQASNSLGAISGTTSAAITVQASQSAVGADAVTSASTLAFGIEDDDATIAANGDVRLLVSGNVVGLQSDLNRSSQSIGAVSGVLGSGLSTNLSQSASEVGGDRAQAQATGANIRFGIDGLGSDIGSGDNTLDLQVDGNAVAASAQINVATRELGAITGQQAGAVFRIADQSAAGADAQASLSALSFGLSGVDNGGFENSSDSTSLGVSGNSVNATARQNLLVDSSGGVAGVQSSTSGANISQSGNSATSSATIANAQFGVGGSSVSLNLGATAGGTSLTVSGNQTRADSAGNIASYGLGGIDGSLTADRTVDMEQSQTATTVSAVSTNLDFGANALGGSSIGDGGSVALSLVDNSVVTVATANSQTVNTGALSGSIASGNTLGAFLNQSNGGNIDATASDLDLGTAGAGTIADGGAAVSQAITGNQVVTAGTGNASSSVLGAITGDLAGTVLRQLSQSNSAASDLDALSTDIAIGAIGAGSLGTNGAAPLAVSGNAIATSLTGNSSSVVGAVSGNLSGTLMVNDTQSNSFNANGFSASTVDVDLGVVRGASTGIGGDARLAVSDNSISAAITGNSLRTELSGLAVGDASGTVSLNGTQTATGTAGNTAELSATVLNADLGFTANNATLTLPSATVDGNRVVASATSNQSVRLLGGLSGQLSGTGVSVLDTQTNTQMNVNASVTGPGLIGGSATSTDDIPLNLAVNNNLVVAEAAGNRSTQDVQLAGLSLNGGADLNLRAVQSNVGGSVAASVSGQRLGLLAAGSGVFGGSVTSSGNNVGASAVGNTARLTRGR